MKKNTSSYLTWGSIIFLAIVTLVYLTKRFISTRSKPDELYEQVAEPVLGVYDRDEKMTNAKAVTIKHFIIKWNNADEGGATKKLAAVFLENKNDILLTIQLWSTKGEAYSNHGVLQGTVNGVYDKKIIKLCSVIAAVKQIIYLRWNPEMEVPVNKYQWQGQSSNLYIEAFRHFTAVCKKYAPGVKIVWGPSGYAGAMEYWPGADVTDFVSLTLAKPPVLLSTQYPEENSIPTQIKRKLHRLRFINKPVFILGSEKVIKDTFNNQWLEQAIQDIKKDTEIIYSQKNFIRYNNATNSINSNIEIGVFDPEQQLVEEKSVTTEHLFANLGSLKDGVFKQNFKEVIARKHNVIVTMEPWKDKNLEKDSDVLIHTLNGNYDPEIKELYKIISNVKQTVYLRWAHEMEIPIDRYPWQSKDPVIYIKAFRYFMHFTHHAKNIRKVWGPTGDRGALDFWPGDDVVDYISLAIYGLPDKNITDHNKQESFSTIFRRKYNRISIINKPIFITEFGVKGPQSYKKKWLDDAAVTIKKNPQIAGVSYFNFADSPKAWGKIEPPDWTITKETFLHFTEQVSSK